jgi:hypothetical protein
MVYVYIFSAFVSLKSSKSHAWKYGKRLLFLLPSPSTSMAGLLIYPIMTQVLPTNISFLVGAGASSSLSFLQETTSIETARSEKGILSDWFIFILIIFKIETRKQIFFFEKSVVHLPVLSSLSYERKV